MVLLGRADVFEPEEDIYWGPETEWLDDKRYTTGRVLEEPLGAVQMGLIYVNPEGPNGNPDPQLAANDIRETFGRMAMNDEETVALIAGGHTFGKAHGAANPDEYVGPEPEGAPVEQMSTGWKNSFGPGHGEHTISSGLEGAWTEKPATWDNNYFENLFGYEWKQTKSPAGATQWIPTDESAASRVPDAHNPSKTHAPVMFTTDLAMRVDPAYEKISRRFADNPDQFADAFARAWYKLTHRDMGPKVRSLGPWVPAEELIWQDPVPAVDHPLVSDADIAALKGKIAATGLSVSQLVSTAWASASTFRGTDLRGGANGARVRLAPQKDWDVNGGDALATVLSALEGVQNDFNASATSGTKVSLADVIVLAGGVGVEMAAKKAGHDITVGFTPGRTDASEAQTDAASFDVLEPRADGFRNYIQPGHRRSAAEHLVDKAHMLNLSAPEMTVLVGGLRVLGANAHGSKAGVFTDKADTLSNDFFVNVLDLDTTWAPAGDAGMYQGTDRASGASKWTATAVDLLFGSNSQLRAISEIYASSDSSAKFVSDFAAAWVKVMENDRFDLA